MSNLKRKITIVIDKVLGELIFFILTIFIKSKNKKINLNPNKVSRILIIRPGGIGDYLVSVPFFKNVKKKFPDAKIDLICFNRNSICLDLYSNFNKVYVIDSFPGIISFLLEKKYSLCFDLDQIRKIPSIFSVLSGASIRVGFDTSNRRKLYTHLVQYSQEEYETLCIMKQLKYFSLDITIEEKDLRLNFNKVEIEKVKTSVEIPNDKKKIAVYATALKPENRLSLKLFSKILKKYDSNTIFYFIGGKQDKIIYNKLEKLLFSNRIIRCDGKFSLRESMVLMSLMDKFIGNDGGVFHMAVFSGVPTVSFWGPSIMEKWKPLDKKHIGIKSEMVCSPCTYGRFAEFKGCPYNNKCMKELKIENENLYN